jgi:hypothetical protein
MLQKSWFEEGPKWNEQSQRKANRRMMSDQVGGLGLAEMHK